MKITTRKISDSQHIKFHVPLQRVRMHWTFAVGCSVLQLFLLAVPVNPAHADSVATNGVRRSCCAAMENSEAVVLSDKSIYQLNATWTNDGGQSIQLSALKGRPQVVTMFFANCQFACPLLVYKMRQIAAALPENVRTNIGFTLVSFDSERDTPGALHTYRAQHELASNWTLLRGSANDVLDLAALLGVKFKKDAQGQFAHSNIITILNSDGEIVFQETGLNLESKEIVTQIERLRK